MNLSFLPFRPRCWEQTVPDVRCGEQSSVLSRSPLYFLFLGLVIAPTLNTVVTIVTVLLHKR